MPLPKSLQQAIDDTPAPDATGVFDFEKANKVVPISAPTPPEPDIDTTKENWLENLMTDDVAATNPDGTPIDASAIDDMFLTDTSTEPGLPDISGAPESNAQFDELKGIITALEGKINKTDADDAQKKLLDDALASLKEKYGVVDQDILDNFSELHATFRASVGQDLEAEMIRSNLANEERIKQLEAKIEGLSAAPAAAVPDATASPTDYRNLMAEAVPTYSKIVSSTQFKQLMNTPVDPDNPEFTYNKKLGKLYTARKTAEIMQFFSSFADKYMAGGGSNGAVVDNGVSSSSQGGQPQKGLSPDRLRSILSKVMKGELKLSEADMLKLRTMAAKQAMD